MRLLVHSAKQAVVVSDSGEAYLAGDRMARVVIREHPAGISVAVDGNGKIEKIGSNPEIQNLYSHVKFDEIIDASNMCILPGLIDAHTHPIWGGDRVREFEMKLAGATYLQIHEQGGGIFFTVEETRKKTDDELYESLKRRLELMAQSGTTLVECKSGYGLEKDEEMRLLKIIENVKEECPIEISSTYCGAHAIPKNKTAEEATLNIVNDQIPELKQLIDRGILSVENIDAFCEKKVFDTDQSRRILEAGKHIGLRINFHGDELYPTKSAEMGASIGATAISHLEEISNDGISAMAKSNCVAVILPTTAYIMKLKAPPVQHLIKAGVPVALGTDFNPNAYCLSMPMVMNLACTALGMSMPQALNAATINSAASLGRSGTHGSIEVGKYGDLIILNAPRWEHIIYQMGNHHNLIHSVIKKGRVIHRNHQASHIQY
ncbi:probable imidazolonepropionase [Ischnura elegans]|uniref:probable imidazolonepropionase n=1 Tax=Ischnura elegans TaxID=197161 RepID=UPI001ED8981E|nr:probable imidazolonepropionase [Ischnura elegans]